MKTIKFHPLCFQISVLDRLVEWLVVGAGEENHLGTATVGAGEENHGGIAAREENNGGIAVGEDNPEETLARISLGMFGGHINASGSAGGNYSPPLEELGPF